MGKILPIGLQSFRETYAGGQFGELLQKLHEKYDRQVVILIDEYDKPITDYLEDLEQAKTQRPTQRLGID